MTAQVEQSSSPPSEEKIEETSSPPSTLGLTLKSDEACKNLKFEDYYRLKEKLSKGSFGTVYVTEHNETKEEYAVKVINRSTLKQKDNDAVVREVTILRDCREIPHIVRLIDFFDSPENFYVVQVYARGGDVFQRLATRSSYNEKEARDLATKLLDAIAHLHERKIAHRDLKPENLLLHDLIDDTTILVADFGFAKYVPDEGLKTHCGTPAFVAPEVLVANCRYDETVDMWSAGCLLFMLLSGYPPFQDKSHAGLFRKIRCANFCFHEAYWKNVSVSAKQLIGSMLTVEHDLRCTARMALDNAHWLRMSDGILMAHDLSASLGEIKKFHARKALKGAMHTVMFGVRQRLRSAFFTKQIDDFQRHALSKNLTADEILSTVKTELKFKDVYEVKDVIHESPSHCVIWDCVNKVKGGVYAVKIIPRGDEDQRGPAGRTVVERSLHEVALLNSLKHKHIIKVVDFFEEDDKLYLVMEKMEGGDLFNRLIAKKRYSENDARLVARNLLSAMSYIHEQGITHRDLKPQNILLPSKGDDTNVKIADFAFACRVHNPQSLTTRCGTPTYVAPEILKNVPYDQSADMWSLGVIFYVLLCGYPPFVDDNQNFLFQKIRMGEFEFHKQYWKNISDDAKDLIRKMLQPNPQIRVTAQDALKSEWITKGGTYLPAAAADVVDDDDDDQKETDKLGAASEHMNKKDDGGMAAKLRRAKSLSKLKAAAKTVVFMNRCATMQREKQDRSVVAQVIGRAPDE